MVNKTPSVCCTAWEEAETAHAARLTSRAPNAVHVITSLHSSSADCARADKCTLNSSALGSCPLCSSAQTLYVQQQRSVAVHAAALRNIHAAAALRALSTEQRSGSSAQAAATQQRQQQQQLLQQQRQQQRRSPSDGASSHVRR
eukprot:TRINITY_DN400_c0_g1_i1.p3 TRINITY_DN400_c0_g1~~TRINITY_DN400_c0_g1_i1.p3  ORF type:complete len:144 (+),score=53.16 TRINITY_DN400_c0_g1_i1:730-1161(+)